MSLGERGSGPGNGLRGLAAAALALAACEAVVAETEFSASVAYEAEVTDNVEREEDNEETDVIHRPSVSANYSASSRRAQADIASTLRGRIFQDNSFDNEQVWTVDGSSEIGFFEDRLRWNADVNRQETLRDDRDRDTPDNRQETTDLETRATLVLFVADPHELSVNAGAGRLIQAADDDDRVRYTGGVDYRFLLSRNQHVGLRGTVEEVDFDAAEDEDFTRLSGTVTYGVSGKDTSLSAEIGFNSIDRDFSGTTGGLTAALDGSWAITPAQTVTASVSRRFTDRNDTGRGALDFGELRGDIANEATVFEVTSASLGYTLDRLRWSFGVDVIAQDEQSESEFAPDDDERQYSLSLSWGYELARNLTLDVRATARLQEFEEAMGDRDDERYSTDARLSWALGPRTRLSFGAGYDQRESTDNNQDFDELSAFIGISRQIF